MIRHGKGCGLRSSSTGFLAPSQRLWGGNGSCSSPTLLSPSLQVEYLLKKICTAMNVELNSCELDDYLSQEPQGQGGLTVWQFLDMVNSGRLLRGIEQEAISMAVEEVYQEVIEDVLKQARSPRALGHKLSLGVFLVFSQPSRAWLWCCCTTTHPSPAPLLMPVSPGRRATCGRRAS